MSEDLFNQGDCSVVVPRNGYCTVSAALADAGYTEFVAKPQEEEVLHSRFKVSPLSCHFLWSKSGRSFMFDKWQGHKDKNGWEEPDAVVIRDVTELLKVSA